MSGFRRRKNLNSVKKRGKTCFKKSRQLLSSSSLQPATHFKPSISLCTQSHPAYCNLWPPQEGCVLHIIFLFMITASVVAAVLFRDLHPFPVPPLHLVRLQTLKSPIRLVQTCQEATQQRACRCAQMGAGRFAGKYGFVLTA